MDAESPAAVMVVTPSMGETPALVERFGPVVLRRFGDRSEIFQASRLGPGARGALWAAWGVTPPVLSTIFDFSGWPKSVAYLTAGVGVALVVWSRTVRWRRSFSRIPLVERLADVPSGTVIRVVGKIEAEGKLCRGPGSDVRAVFARTQFWPGGYRDRPSHLACEEVRGSPFRLRLADGVSLRLLPSDVTLVGRGKRLNVRRDVREALGAALRGRMFRREPEFREAVLAPGDEIEAVGRLNTEVSAAGDGAPVRGVPLVHSLRPMEKAGVLVRRVSTER